MKTTSIANPSAIHSPVRLCRKMVAAIRDLKARLIEKYEQTLPGRSQLVRMAIAEAEAMAWQTSFPHLLFPDFAEARVAEVVHSHEPAPFAQAA